MLQYLIKVLRLMTFLACEFFSLIFFMLIKSHFFEKNN